MTTAKEKREYKLKTMTGMLARIRYNMVQSLKTLKYGYTLGLCSAEEYSEFMYDKDFVAYYTQWLESGFKKELKPTVFRINNHLGYVPSNMKLDTYENYRKTFGGNK